MTERSHTEHYCETYIIIYFKFYIDLNWWKKQKEIQAGKNTGSRPKLDLPYPGLNDLCNILELLGLVRMSKWRK